MSDSIFTKIIAKEIPADILYEDELAIAIRDVAPQAPVHILVIPKKPIVSIGTSTEEDTEIMGHLMSVVRQIAQKEGIEQAFRLVVNNGADAGQSVFHLHLHILAGRPFNWPPG